MTYAKLNLADGDVLKAEHLAHMEDELEQQSAQMGSYPYKRVTLVSGTVEFETNEEGAVMCSFAVDMSLLLPGNVVTIEWDGDKYEYVLSAVGAKMPSNAFCPYGETIFGNASSMGLPPSDEPFFAGVDNGQMMMFDFNASGNVSHEIKVEVLALQGIFAPCLAFVETDSDGRTVLKKSSGGQVWGGKEFVDAYASGRRFVVYEPSKQYTYEIVGVSVVEMYGDGVAVSLLPGGVNIVFERIIAYTTAVALPEYAT